jgi:outer membrane biosynthesis protein TonB
VSAELLLWHDEHDPDHRRRLRAAFFVSLAAHGVLLALFAISPPRPRAKMPEYVAVDLVAALPKARPAPKSPPAPKAPSVPPTPPVPKAAPAPPPPAAEPPPPIAKAPVQVLPEETPGRIRKAKPKPVERPRPRKQEKALSYEDAMAALGDELGGDETDELLQPRAVEEPVDDATSSGGETGPQAGIRVSPEQLAWNRAVIERIQDRFRSTAFMQFSGRGLVTGIEIEVTASGELIGEPQLVSTSGDVAFDRQVIEVLLRVGRAGLPPPPRPGPVFLEMNSDQ